MSQSESIGITLIDIAKDSIEKISSPASRAGSTVERAGRMLEEGVCADVIALQMTSNSPNQQVYNTSDVQAYGKIYFDSKTKVVITSKQTRALIKDQRENSLSHADLAPQH